MKVGLDERWTYEQCMQVMDSKVAVATRVKLFDGNLTNFQNLNGKVASPNARSSQCDAETQKC